MEQSKFKTLIIGASFYGMALLKALGDDAILVERGYRIGEEFSSSLRVNRFSGSVSTELGKCFLERMREHRLIDENGAIYSVPSAYLLADMMSGVNALFATDILSAEKENDTYRITLFNQEGRHTVYADRIIDTTAEGAVRAELDGIKKKLNVILSAPAPETEYDSFTGCNVCGFDAGIKEALPEVRRRLYEFLEQKQEPGAVFIADVFDYDIREEICKREDNYYIVPSLGFGDPISAVDKGGGGLTYGI